MQLVRNFLAQYKPRPHRSLAVGRGVQCFITDERIRSAAPRLKDLGQPISREADPPTERGGMRVDVGRLSFPNAKLRASLYRTPDGKIQQLLLYGE
jgi:D-alanyl-D-alanine carboxypeptidase